jgi:hypothetical protein
LRAAGEVSVERRVLHVTHASGFPCGRFISGSLNAAQQKVKKKTKKFCLATEKKEGKKKVEVNLIDKTKAKGRIIGLNQNNRGAA